jgi:hypothetical protein
VIVVADAGPIHYFVLIEAANVRTFCSLYTRTCSFRDRKPRTEASYNFCSGR